MLLILVIILLLLGSSVVGSIYSSFMVFYSNFFESEAYHKAYYASISAIERGELVTKQRQPGYIGSGGFIEGTGQGSRYNGGSDSSLSGFSYLGDKENKNTVFWTINSRTTRIPTSGKGDIERTLSTGDSKHYNKMGYENAEVFLLYYDDNLGENPYKKIKENELTKSEPQQIAGQIRLPGLLKNRFRELDTELPLAGSEGSMPGNDGIVDRQFRGEYNNGDTSPFTIYSTQKIELVNNRRKEKIKEDSVFREGDINNNLNFKFGDSNNPFNNSSSRGRDNSITVISEKENEILSALDNKFQGIFNKSQFIKPQLRFSLLNLVQGSGAHLYPFLEYYVDFGGEPVSDKYYTINGEGNFKDYQINTIIQKPTVKETILGSFTSIF